jgi:hypothetical protein
MAGQWLVRAGHLAVVLLDDGVRQAKQQQGDLLLLPLMLLLLLMLLPLLLLPPSTARVEHMQLRYWTATGHGQ